jgi:hypothetical protein
MSLPEFGEHIAAQREADRLVVAGSYVDVVECGWTEHLADGLEDTQHLDPALVEACPSSLGLQLSVFDLAEEPGRFEERRGGELDVTSLDLVSEDSEDTLSSIRLGGHERCGSKPKLIPPLLRTNLLSLEHHGLVSRKVPASEVPVDRLLTHQVTVRQVIDNTAWRDAFDEEQLNLQAVRGLTRLALHDGYHRVGAVAVPNVG